MARERTKSYYISSYIRRVSPSGQPVNEIQNYSNDSEHLVERWKLMKNMIPLKTYGASSHQHTPFQVPVEFLPCCSPSVTRLAREKGQ